MDVRRVPMQQRHARAPHQQRLSRHTWPPALDPSPGEEFLKYSFQEHRTTYRYPCGERSPLSEVLSFWCIRKEITRKTGGNGLGKQEGTLSISKMPENDRGVFC
ncbi:hypothetical protein U0070_001598 [Myodes glareolus]|uniref:Uncharacterized protein n=1 Tax=Myodes glareolus TaxID=447135 RepID=A0AAW0IWL2_MYOGA